MNPGAVRDGPIGWAAAASALSRPPEIAGRACPSRSDTGPRVAVVVATSHCSDEFRNRRGGVIRDARDMEAVLADPAFGACTVTCLMNLTSQEIRLGIEDFLAERNSNDQVVVYWAGHAIRDARDRLFFAGTDTRTDRLASTSVEARWLAEQLDECAAKRQIVILDTDHSGAFARVGLGTSAGAGGPPGRARAILTSCQDDQGVTNDGAGGAVSKPSSFTGLLVHGLKTGRADVDADGVVTVEDAYAFVRDHVSASGAAHTPAPWMSGRGRLVLARSPQAGTAVPAAAHDSDRDHRPHPMSVTGDSEPDSSPEPDRASDADRSARHGIGAQPHAWRSPQTAPGRQRVPGATADQVLDVRHATPVAREPGRPPTSGQGPDTAQLAEVARARQIETVRLGTVAGQPDRPCSSRRRQIGDVLVATGVITSEQLDLAAVTQQEAPGPRRWIGRVVVDLGLASEQEVAESLARMLRLELIDLSKVVPAPDVVRLLPRAVAERTRVLVIDRTPHGELVVAASDPTNVLAFDDVRLYTRSSELKVYVATDSQIRDQLNQAWSLGSDSSRLAEIVQDAATAKDERPEQWLGPSDEDPPIVRLVNQILGDGVRLRASDIHIEVQRDTLRVRYRVDGLLREVMEAPRRVATSVISRIKIISGLDIAERRVPQDGRTRFSVEGMAKAG